MWRRPPWGGDASVNTAFPSRLVLQGISRLHEFGASGLPEMIVGRLQLVGRIELQEVSTIGIGLFHPPNRHVANPLPGLPELL